MHAAAEGKSTIGIPAKVGKDFVAADHGRKVGRLPKHVPKGSKKLAKRGLISPKQMQRMREG
jgi:hypothetical protein